MYLRSHSNKVKLNITLKEACKILGVTPIFKIK